MKNMTRLWLVLVTLIGLTACGGEDAEEGRKVDASGKVDADLGAVPADVLAAAHAAMRRLEAIADVRQRAPDDYAHGVIQIGLSHFVFEIYRGYFFSEFSHLAMCIHSQSLAFEGTCQVVFMAKK